MLNLSLLLMINLVLIFQGQLVSIGRYLVGVKCQFH
jgi:hypothetical protein